MLAAARSRLGRPARAQGTGSAVSVRSSGGRRPIAVRASEQQPGGAAQPEAGSGAAPAVATQPPPPAPQQPTAGAPAPQAPVLAKGQGTAILTGAISIVFGVAYLALVYIMDMRGGEMLPPPPEAFGP